MHANEQELILTFLEFYTRVFAFYRLFLACAAFKMTHYELDLRLSLNAFCMNKSQRASLCLAAQLVSSNIKFSHMEQSVFLPSPCCIDEVHKISQS